eukprot:SAG31_NODE_23233_length_508_cov_1.391198_1_plen_47_part_10
MREGFWPPIRFRPKTLSVPLRQFLFQTRKYSTPQVDSWWHSTQYYLN